ncbi:hypothetical protein DICVIV_08321 [Dictyocaulus viviparus]|uniref:Uncharacterized protein n=1 Tax=Dictyocaulus viviparus TaxID=29172 RepID=A0A0D8XLW9_DICVI|nr:hypothetical protein DICVIV_08321 [Dictyocaulus viviparus]
MEGSLGFDLTLLVIFILMYRFIGLIALVLRARFA